MPHVLCIGRCLMVLLMLPMIARATVLIDFDSAADLASFSGRTSGTVTGQYTWTSATGVGSPDGAVTHNNTGDNLNHENLFYTGQVFDYADGPLQVSVFFRAAAATGAGNSRNFLGFATTTDTNLASGTSKLGVRVFKGSSSTTWSFQLLNGTTTTTIGDTFALTDGNWYRMLVTLTATGTANQFLVEGALHDFGPDGVSTPTLLRSSSTTATNSAMGGDSTWNVGLLGQLNNGGASAFDNLAIEVIPEPASLALVLIAAPCFLARGRKP